MHSSVAVPLGSLLLALAASHGGAERVDFNRDVRPILASKCFACHGPDAGARKAKLRLDTEEGARADRGGYAAVVAGDADESELVLRVQTDDDAERMPPPDSHKSLTADELDVLVRWVEQGAQWGEHWAYEAPAAGEPPVVRKSTWALDPADAWVLARLEREGLAPAPEADRRTLARRLHLDLVGLPPTPEAVDAFEADRDPRAYENLVERLLASPHYGERMAMHWLDVVRYADTNGYHGDQKRRVSLFRDYVIDAFNANMPFDRFTIEQLAGDLLPEPTRDQLVASGYSRLGMTSSEGGGQPGEYLAKYASERVRAVSTAWMGATLGCAECHDHKFDPYTATDFYRFAAFFADIAEEGIAEPVHQRVPSLEQAAARAALDARLGAVRSVLDTPTPELDRAQAQWEARMRAEAARGEHTDFDWVDDGQGNGGNTQGKWVFVTKDEGRVLSGVRSRLQTGAAGSHHYFVGATRSVTVGRGDRWYAYVFIDPADPPRTVMLQFNVGGWEHRAFWGEDRIGLGGIGKDAPGHRPMGALPRAGEWVRLEVDPARVGLRPGSVVDGMSFDQFGGTVYWDRAGIHTADPRLRLGGASEDVHAAFLIPPGERTPEQAAALAAHYRSVAPVLEAQQSELLVIEAERVALEATIPMALTAVTQEPRTMRVLPRGDWMDESGPEVQPGVPSFLGQFGKIGDLDGAQRATRLDLAHWLIEPDHPLTARVFVNRLWRLFHGRGLCGSVVDFGAQGEWPDHPELLDRLALDFIASGWDTKALVRRMVSTRTYRQSSEWRPEVAALDPEGRLFARQARFRIDAEMVRDSALAISGLLDRRIGGPSVNPYQPANYWAQLNFPERRWVASKGSDQYRRGVYTFWCRTFLHPSLAAFDAPTREECTVERNLSNTPQQALVLLNDPTYVEAAEALAARAIEQGAIGDEKRVTWIFRRALARAPFDDERAVLTRVLRDQRSRYGAQYGSEGEAAELGAWVSIARIVLNLSEVITRS